MGKKILYIVLGALVVFGLLFLLWSWFFGGSTNTQGTAGTLGSAGNATSTLGSGANSGNGEVPLGTNTNQVQTLPNGQNTSGSVGINNAGGAGSGTGASGNGITGATSALTSVSGVNWIGSPFNPDGINTVSGSSGSSVPNITITTITNPSNSNSLLTVLAGTAIAGSLSCAIQAGVAGFSTAGAAAGTGGLGVVTGAATSPPGVLVNGYGALIVADAGVRAATVGSYTLQASQANRAAGKDNVTFLGCIVNTIAKVALAQITASVVNWINSGFNGQPSFVSNYQQFFANTADLAAGQFIQGAGLSFLCSPFQLQIKIAIAQSYANRNAQSCTLTKVIGNVNSFMNGNFSQGGWGGLVSFTTVPTNNPYGAFAYAQVGLQTAQQNAVANAKNNISPTGFLNLQKVSCPNTAPTISAAGSNVAISSAQASQAAKSGASCPSGCNCQVTTPGGAIATSLDNTLKTGTDQLGLANDIDQIINALTTQLLTRTLQNGLTSLSQPTTQTSTDVASQSQALDLLNDMQARSTLAQQLGAIYQGSIGDIQSAQAQLSTLVNCWQNSTSAQASANASSTAATLQSLEDQVTADNNAITQINSGIAQLNQFQSELSEASSADDVAAVAAEYNGDIAAGAFVSQTDVTTGQQNRTTLQSQLAAINQSTQTGLAQCNAGQ